MLQEGREGERVGAGDGEEEEGEGGVGEGLWKIGHGLARTCRHEQVVWCCKLGVEGGGGLYRKRGLKNTIKTLLNIN